MYATPFPWARNLRLAPPALVVTTLAYVASYKLRTIDAEISPIWLANAALLAPLIVARRRQRCAVLAGGALGNLAARLLVGHGLGVSLADSFANLLEVVIALEFAPRISMVTELIRLKPLAKFLVGGALLAPIASGLLNTLLQATQPGGAQWLALVNWFASHALGLAIFTPAAVAFWTGEVAHLLHAGRRRRNGFLLLLVCAVTIGVFGQSRFHLLYWALPPILPSSPMLITISVAFNRRHFDRELERIWHQHAQADSQNLVAAIMIDIDAYKSYNDHYGHQRGDECLRRVAQAIASAARRPTDVVARYGGEEFVLILADTDQHGALIVAERIRASIENLRIPHPAYPTGIVTVSVGVAAQRPGHDGDGSGGLVAAADRALYGAKQRGRNRTLHGGYGPRKPCPRMITYNHDQKIRYHRIAPYRRHSHPAMESATHCRRHPGHVSGYVPGSWLSCCDRPHVAT